MDNGCVARALELARTQAGHLARGDFDAYAATLPAYAAACEQVSNLPGEALRAATPELADLVETDRALGQQFALMKDEVLGRMGSLRRAGRVAAAYFAVPALRGGGERSA